MVEQAKWLGAGWVREDGFLKSEAGGELISAETLGDYGFYAEVHEAGDFRLILRRTGAGDIRFSINRADSSAVFAFFPAAGPSIVLREWDLGDALENDRAMLDVRCDSDGFRLRINGFAFTLESEKARELLSADAHAYPTAGVMGIVAGNDRERWAWLALSRAAGLRAPTASRFEWANEGGEKKPLMLHSVSAARGAAGDEVIIKGEGFNTRTRVQIGKQGLESRFVSPGEIAFTVGEDTRTGPLTLHDPADPERRTPPISFHVRMKPALTSVVPASLPGGEIFKIFGERLVSGNIPPEIRLGDSPPLEILRTAPEMVEVRAPVPDSTLRNAPLRLVSDGMEAAGDLNLTVEVWRFKDLVEQSHLARWRNGRPGEEGILTFGRQGDAREGAAALLEGVRLEDGNVHDRVLYMAAPDPDQIMLDGFYPDERLKPGSRLFLKFGFRHDARATDGARFSVHFYHRLKRDWYVVMPRVFKVYDGELAVREIELDEVLPLREWRESEGKDLSGAFSLRVEPGASGQDDHACWLDARIGAM